MTRFIVLLSQTLMSRMRKCTVLRWWEYSPSRHEFMMDVDLNSPNVVIAAESVASQLVFVAADSERCRIIYFAHDVAL